MLETEWKTTTREQEWKFSKPSKSFQDETVSSLTATTNEYISADENLSFTKEQLDLLYKIMGKSEVTPTSTSCAFAQSSTLHKALTTTVVSNSNSQIIN